MITLPSPQPLPSGLASASAEYYPNVPFGPLTDIQLLDFLKTTVTTDPTPVVIFVHGGGFTSGSRTFINQGGDASDVVELTQAGISVATVDYRLIETDDSEGIQKCLDDIALAVAAVRESAEELGIDPTKVGMRGKSAGSAASMYLAGKPNPPNAIACSRPMPMDVLDWPNYFTTITMEGLIANYGEPLYNLYGMPWDGTPDVNDFDPEVTAQWDTVANLVYQSALGDVWIHNADSPAEPTNHGTLVHHPNFSQAFHSKLLSLGYRSAYYTDPTPNTSIPQFFMNAFLSTWRECRLTLSGNSFSFKLKM